MPEVVEKEDAEVICPHCSKVLTEIWYKHVPGFMFSDFVYFCQHCRKILGIGTAK